MGICPLLVVLLSCVNAHFHRLLSEMPLEWQLPGWASWDLWTGAPSLDGPLTYTHSSPWRVQIVLPFGG